MNKNDEFNENFTLTKQKKQEVYKQRSIDVWLGRNFEYNYVNTEHEKPSLPVRQKDVFVVHFLEYLITIIQTSDVECCLVQSLLLKITRKYHGNGMIGIQKEKY